MELFVARAFLNRLLNSEQKSDLVAYERSDLPQGRYLQEFEVCRRYRLKPDPIPEAELEEMEKLKWIWDRQWETKFEALRAIHGDEPFNVNGDEWDGDLRDWEKFAEKNYQSDPLDLLGVSR